MGLRSLLAVFSSLGLHLAVLSVIPGAPAAAQPAAPPSESRDIWSGDTVDVETLLARQSDRKTQPPGAGPPQPATGPPAKPAAPPTPKAPPAPAEPQPKRAPAPKADPVETKPAQAPPKPEAEPPPAGPEAPAPPSQTPRPRSAPSAPPASTDQPKLAADGDAGAGVPRSGSVTDLPPGVRRLDKAFVRAITAATHRDPYWRQLPAGPVGTVQVHLSVDEEGKLGELTTTPETPAEAMTRLLKRTRAMLLRGRFAVPSGQGAGKIELSIEVLLRDDPRTEDEDNPHAAVTLGFDPPTEKRSGRAYFLLASGRYFEATVALK